MSVNGDGPAPETDHERLAEALRGRLLRYGGLGVALGAAAFAVAARHGAAWIFAVVLPGGLIVVSALATRTTRALAGAFKERLVLVGCVAVGTAFGLGVLAGGLAAALYVAFS